MTTTLTTSFSLSISSSRLPSFWRLKTSTWWASHLRMKYLSELRPLILSMPMPTIMFLLMDTNNLSRIARTSLVPKSQGLTTHLVSYMNPFVHPISILRSSSRTRMNQCERRSKRLRPRPRLKSIRARPIIAEHKKNEEIVKMARAQNTCKISTKGM